MSIFAPDIRQFDGAILQLQDGGRPRAGRGTTLDEYEAAPTFDAAGLENGWKQEHEWRDIRNAHVSRDDLISGALQHNLKKH
jgi:hypothetical protein